MNTAKSLRLACLLFLSCVVSVACNNDDPSTEKERISDLLTSGDWTITHLFLDSSQTSRYKEFVLRFQPNQTLLAMEANVELQGDWAVHKSFRDDNMLALNVGDTTIAFSGNWKIVDYTKTDFRLEGSEQGLNIGTLKKFSMTKVLP